MLTRPDFGQWLRPGDLAPLSRPYQRGILGVSQSRDDQSDEKAGTKMGTEKTGQEKVRLKYSATFNCLIGRRRETRWGRRRRDSSVARPSTASSSLLRGVFGGVFGGVF